MVNRPAFKWIIAGLALVGLAAGLYVFFHRRPTQAAPGAIVVVPQDSTRDQLQQRADSATQQLIITHHGSQTSVSAYEKAKQKFDTLRFTLP